MEVAEVAELVDVAEEADRGVETAESSTDNKDDSAFKGFVDAEPQHRLPEEGVDDYLIANGRAVDVAKSIEVVKRLGKLA